MYISFENDVGSIRMTGGGDSTWRLIAAEGLEPVQYDAQAVYMSGGVGRVTTSLQSLERTIILKGDIELKNSDRALTKAAEILSREGELKITKGTKKRRITARCTAFTADREYGGIRSFVMQFVCDDPFFTDFDVAEADIWTIKKMLYGSFKIGEGIYLSAAHANAIVTNMGVKEAEPVITIACGDADMQGTKITITNRTTGQTLILNTTLKAGDVIVADIPGRRILINGAERFDVLDESSYLSDFYLAPGNNDVAVESDSNSDRMSAAITHRNRYNEAMI